MAGRTEFRTLMEEYIAFLEESVEREKEKYAALESGCVKCGNFTLESGYEKAKELFTEHPDVDTLICATDTMAVGAANWLKENGYQIPQQVQIAGMGDSFLGKIIEPKLTTASSLSVTVIYPNFFPVFTICSVRFTAAL